jgi:hypothetical protein
MTNQLSLYPPGRNKRLATVFSALEGHNTLARGLPVLEQEAAQLASGDAKFISTQVLGRDVILGELEIEARYAAHLVLDPTWCALFAPLRWRGDFIFNGEQARLGDIFLTGGPDGYATLAQDRHTLIIGLRRTRLQAACAALAGYPLEGPDLSDRKLTLSTGLGSHLRRSISEAMAASPCPLMSRRV